MPINELRNMLPMKGKLKGFISVCEYRDRNTKVQRPIYLVCRRFWKQEASFFEANEYDQFIYQEKFVINNYTEFLEQVKMQYLHLELWQNISDHIAGRASPFVCKMNPLGVALLPLHQFYIAYKDEAMIHRLREEKLPVISVDDWVEVNLYTANKEECNTIGELKCMLAIGFEEQIDYMLINKLKNNTTYISKDIVAQLLSLKMSKSMPPADSIEMNGRNKCEILQNGDRHLSQIKIKNRSQSNKSVQLKSNSTLDSDQLISANLFKVVVEILEASGLPLNPTIHSKRTAKYCHLIKNYPPNEAPNCYVSFQVADQRNLNLHTGNNPIGNQTYTTRTIEKNVHPIWNERFHINLPTDYREHKSLNLMVWKTSSYKQYCTTPLKSAATNDVLIGNVSIYLYPLAKGEKEICGTYLIRDSAGRNNGQLKCRCYLPCNEGGDTTNNHIIGDIVEQFSQSLDITKLNIGDAIERKFRELESINERLKKRLSEVAGVPISAKKFNYSALKKWQPLNIEEDSEENKELDKFDLYINTILEPTKEEGTRNNVDETPQKGPHAESMPMVDEDQSVND